jgi:preprotein translocase subunit SecF
MFTNKLKITAGISITVIFIGLIFGIIFGGLNMGIDFTGGSLMTVDIKKEYDTETIRDVLVRSDAADAPIVKAGENYTQAQIRLQNNENEEGVAVITEGIIAGIQETYPDAELVGIERVGGVTSAELVRNAILAVVVACVAMLIYIWYRFELYSGISAVIALIQDVLIMIAFMCIARIQVNSGFIAACLTIVGYSINNTIVIFDRIRDNKKILGLKKYSRNQLANISIKETLTRTINTSATTLIMIVALYIFGVDSIKDFSLPIIIGLLAGTYSSVFLSAPIWAKLADRADDRKKGMKQRKISKSTEKKKMKKV